VSHVEIGVPDLRNRTAQVIDAVKAGERVTLSVTANQSQTSSPTVAVRAGSPARKSARSWRIGPPIQSFNANSTSSPPDTRRTVSTAPAGLLDTSVFIARETHRPLGELPDHVAVSVVTIGELQLGVLNAGSDAARARRADTLALAPAADPIPISEAIMVTWARLVDASKSTDVHRTIKRPFRS
jgi:antitoxin (DNA-binding transcriptional repressor) of toxin-antitoxin stability system